MCIRVQNCCFCISLDIGATAVGILSTVWSTLMVIIYSTPALLRPGLPPARVIFYWTMSGASFLQLMCGLLLIYGAVKKKPQLMQPWSLVGGATGAALLVLCVAGTLYADGSERTSAVIAFYVVYAIILLYFVIVVKSRMEEIQQQEHSDSATRLMWPVNQYAEGAV